MTAPFTHTPGPWVLQTADMIVIGNRGVIADILKYPGTTKELSDKETEANARLIAAAPELLEALSCLLNATMYKDHPIESDMAIAAIKKARGEA